MKTRVKKMLYRALCEREEGKNYHGTLKKIELLLMRLPEETKLQYSFLMFFYRMKTLPFLSYQDYRTLIFNLMGILDRGEINGLK